MRVATLRPLRRSSCGLVACGAVFAAAWPRVASAADAGPGLGASLPVWSALPFVGMLLSIAFLPFIARSVWKHHYATVAAGWTISLLLPLVASYGVAATRAVVHMAASGYLPFVILLGALYTIGGGIRLTGRLHGSPGVNLAFLAVGTLLASLIGTTGAAIVLIRPLLHANRRRTNRAHTVAFFIFLVANIGGGLTPLGNPPLFLGFLNGVPFFWTLSLWRQTLFTVAVLLSVYATLDVVLWRRERLATATIETRPDEPLRIEGAHNLLFLLGAMSAVLVSGIWHAGEVSLLGVSLAVQDLVRDGLLLAMAAGSWWTTRPETREANRFTWEPMREVAVLFAAIFVTIIPVLEMLRSGAHGPFGAVSGAARTPTRLFWACGGLSSFLDNAPTYLAFLSAAVGTFHPLLPAREAVARLVAEHPIYLQAISTGAVFMGANTYIGNAPNFMVRAIAEEEGVPMPSFFGYMLRYTVPFLIPTFAFVTWIFF
ncbi:MAG: sodium:proton antiporter [Thermoanaerobaculales bacterium]